MSEYRFETLQVHKAALALETSWPCARGGAAMIEYGQMTILRAIIDLLPKNID